MSQLKCMIRQIKTFEKQLTISVLKYTSHHSHVRIIHPRITVVAANYSQLSIKGRGDH